MTYVVLTADNYGHPLYIVFETEELLQRYRLWEMFRNGHMSKCLIYEETYADICTALADGNLF